MYLQLRVVVLCPCLSAMYPENTPRINLKFLHKTKCQYKGKLQVYNAIIVAQLTYGHNTLQLTPSLLARLDAFQMRGLRYILGIEHSSYPHTTNEEVYRKANIALNQGADLSLTWEEFIGANKIVQPKYIVKLSGYVMNQQNKALGHIIRADEDDLMKKVTINMETMTQKEVPWQRRSGRPRMKWIEENCSFVHGRINELDVYDSLNMVHKHNIEGGGHKQTILGADSRHVKLEPWP
jgi:hypothetical protein